MKECNYEYCPYCGYDIRKHIKENNCLDTIDIKHFENAKYGIQAEWKDVYECPKCKEKFYVICQH